MTDMSIIQQIIIVMSGVIATMITRFIPFLIFRPGKPTPKFVLYLGKVLPASVFSLLIIYCLRNIFIIQKTNSFEWQLHLSNNAIAQIISVLLTFVMHLWRKNMLLSIFVGTLCYMIIIRIF